MIDTKLSFFNNNQEQYLIREEWEKIFADSSYQHAHLSISNPIVKRLERQHSQPLKN